MTRLSLLTAICLAFLLSGESLTTAQQSGMAGRRRAKTETASVPQASGKVAVGKGVVVKLKAHVKADRVTVFARETLNSTKRLPWALSCPPI